MKTIKSMQPLDLVRCVVAGVGILGIVVAITISQLS